jgi:hypothetical protein
VNDRATVLVGDCRIVAKENNLIDRFDRVSLGLLPSSEGGWRTAVQALRRRTGGWLHVHGNVPFVEVDGWDRWLSSRLRSFLEEEIDLPFPFGTIVLVTHIEKVKSFAPTVNHYVADVFIGPMQRIQRTLGISHLVEALDTDQNNYYAAVLRRNNEIVWCGYDIKSPSCALSADGPINQDWMKE